jgi:hypothetical protein
MVNICRFAVVVGLFAALAGCASSASSAADGKAGNPNVASLDKGGASSAPPADIEAGRPRLRLDATDAENSQLYLKYKECLHDHGATDVDLGTGSGAAAPDGSLTANHAAAAACVQKLPLPPAELDPATNPKLAVQWNDYVRCERKGGIMMHVTGPGKEDWDPGVADIDVDQWQNVDQACLKQVFG